MWDTRKDIERDLKQKASEMLKFLIYGCVMTSREILAENMATKFVLIDRQAC